MPQTDTFATKQDYLEVLNRCRAPKSKRCGCFFKPKATRIVDDFVACISDIDEKLFPKFRFLAEIIERYAAKIGHKLPSVYGEYYINYAIPRYEWFQANARLLDPALNPFIAFMGAQIKEIEGYLTHHTPPRVQQAAPSAADLELSPIALKFDNLTPDITPDTTPEKTKVVQFDNLTPDNTPPAAAATSLPEFNFSVSQGTDPTLEGREKECNGPPFSLEWSLR